MNTTTINKPNAILFILAYLSMIVFTGLFGGLIIFTIAIPAVLELGSFFTSGGAILALIALVSILVAVAAGGIISAVWRGKATGRAGTMILALILGVISALSIPALWLAGLDGIALYVPLITAILLATVSGLVIWGLNRPALRAFFH